MDIEDWRHDLQTQLDELGVGKRDSPLAAPIGHPPTSDDFREAGEIIREAGWEILELRSDQNWLIAEVA